MELKKQYDNFTVYFDILNDKLSIDKEIILENIIESLTCIKFINRDKPFNDLIKLQQKHNSHVLVEFVPEPLDELKYIPKVIYNFLSVTEQLKDFIFDRITITVDGNEITIFSTEALRKNITENTTFSPVIRACWSDPILIEKILKKH